MHGSYCKYFFAFILSHTFDNPCVQYTATDSDLILWTTSDE